MSDYDSPTNQCYSNATELLPGLWVGNSVAANDRNFFKDKQITCLASTSGETFCDDPFIQVRYCADFNLSIAVANIGQLIQTHNILVFGNCPANLIVAYIMQYGSLDLQSAIVTVNSKNPTLEINSQLLLEFEHYLR